MAVSFDPYVIVLLVAFAIRGSWQASVLLFPTGLERFPLPHNLFKIAHYTLTLIIYTIRDILKGEIYSSALSEWKVLISYLIQLVMFHIGLSFFPISLGHQRSKLMFKC